jgi:hypothetical protein
MASSGSSSVSAISTTNNVPIDRKHLRNEMLGKFDQTILANMMTNSTHSHLLRRRIALVRFAREPMTYSASTISKIIRLRSMGLPDRSRSSAGPLTWPRLSQLDNGRVLARINHTNVTQIHGEGFRDRIGRNRPSAGALIPKGVDVNLATSIPVQEGQTH